MVYCINHLCSQRNNPNDAENCLACGTPLLINGRIRLLRPLSSIDEEIPTYTEVFEVEDAGTKLHPGFQIRVMKILKWNEPKLVELVRQEALALQVIEHPGIPESTMDDYFAFPLKGTRIELHCVIMQKIEGENLRQWLEAYGRISQEVALEWFSQLIDIIDLVHRSGFFHRDIKPENIIYQPGSNKLVLVDFGAARRITRTYLTKISTSGGTRTGLGSGHEITSIVTPFFTPLEQIEGQAVPQSDFYALGRTFVNLVTGISLMDIPKNQDRSRLIWRKYAPQIDKPFADLLDDMMAPAPAQRPTNTKVIIQRLKKLPLQTKVQKVLKSKTFIFSVFIGFLTLADIGMLKILLPGLANTLIAGGEKLEIANDSQKAQQKFNLALLLSPQSKVSISTFYFNKASKNLNNPEIAKKYYELAIKYNNQDISAYNNLAIICQQLNDINCVKNSYKNQFKLKHDSWEGHYGLGNFYEQQGKYDLAEKQYEIAMATSDQAIFAVAALARLKNKRGDDNGAAILALQGLNKTNNRELKASLYKDLGWSKLMQNHLTEAKGYLEKAIELDSQRTDAYCLLSQVEEALGKTDDARIHIEVCIIAKSSLPEVFMWRQNLLDRILKK
ncbi:protein kinase domain-containing protein [Nostoc sp. UIC 10890]